MKAIVVESKNTKDTVVKIHGIIGFIKVKGFEQPPIGTELDVMIVGIKVNKDDPTKAVLFCRPIVEDDVLIPHEGFEFTGEHGRCIAKPCFPEEFQFTLTPGMTGIYAARNSDKVRPGWKESPEALRPGKVFIKDGELPKNKFVRVEGLDSVEDLDFWIRNDKKMPAPKPRGNKRPAKKKQKASGVMHLEVGKEPASQNQLDSLVEKFSKH